MASCITTTVHHDFTTNSSKKSKGRDHQAPTAAPPAPPNATACNDHKDYTDREIILTLHSHFRKNQMSNLQGFYLMDADADQMIGAKDILSILKDARLVISLDRVRSLITDFVSNEEEEMNVHGYLRFMASAYAHKYDNQL